MVNILKNKQVVLPLSIIKYQFEATKNIRRYNSSGQGQPVIKLNM